MFSKVVKKMDGKPLSPKWLHQKIGKITANYFPPDLMFMSVLAIELIADTYGRILRNDPSIYKVLRKVSELHNIEEGRHIHYTKMWLERYTQKAGLIKRSIYGLVILLNIYFMRTLYVREEIFESIGVEDPQHYFKEAYKNYSTNFAKFCLDDAIDFMKEINAFNPFTRFLWKRILKANV